MKNLHILPTDKPSNITIRTKTNELMYSYKLFSSKNGKDINVNQNIYITSDEEIKEGDWVLKCKNVNDWNFKSGELEEKDYSYFSVKCVSLALINLEDKKIILTTDQDLIDDGVQSIDDDFLQWFVKNPSCEEVEVQCRYNFYAGQDKIHYKIIIPKEELKQDLEKEMFELEQELDIPSHLRWYNSKPKQETFEEAADEYFKLSHSRLINSQQKEYERELFIAGAKWMQEDIIEKLEMHILINEHDWNRNPQAQFRDFVEQIKKR